MYVTCFVGLHAVMQIFGRKAICGGGLPFIRVGYLHRSIFFPICERHVNVFTTSISVLCQLCLIDDLKG